MKKNISFIIIFHCFSLFSQVPDSLWDQEQLSNVTVLLYQQLTDSTSISGSGTVISYNSRYFLLTASHVALGMRNNAKLIYRLNGDKPEIIDLLQNVKNHSLRWVTHNIADISIIELMLQNEELKKRFDDWSFPITQIYSGKELPARDADLTFLGYPIIDLELEHFSPLVFTGYLASGLITQYRYDTNTKCNFFFLNVPSIQGCSGSGVYFSVKKAMYFGGSKTICIGIVHGTQADNTGGKLAAITPSYYIFDLLDKIF
jgi:hypothetical protein